MPASTILPNRAALALYPIAEKPKTLRATFSRLRHWMLDQIVQDVPTSIQLCEFDCRKTQCTSVEREACTRHRPTL